MATKPKPVPCSKIIFATYITDKALPMLEAIKVVGAEAQLAEMGDVLRAVTSFISDNRALNFDTVSLYPESTELGKRLIQKMDTTKAVVLKLPPPPKVITPKPYEVTLDVKLRVLVRVAATNVVEAEHFAKKKYEDGNGDVCSSNSSAVHIRRIRA